MKHRIKGKEDQESATKSEEIQAPLVVWDESVIEKASSLALEGLCAVRASVARQLKCITKGFYTPPTGPLFVPGMHWGGVLVMGMSGVPVVAAMRWWTMRGILQSDKRSEEEKLLVECGPTTSSFSLSPRSPMLFSFPCFPLPPFAFGSCVTGLLEQENGAEMSRHRSIAFVLLSALFGYLPPDFLLPTENSG